MSFKKTKKNSGALPPSHEVRGNHGNLQSNHNKLFHFPVKSGNRSLWQYSGTECFSWLLLKKRMTFLGIGFRSPIASCNNTSVPSATAVLPADCLEWVIMTLIKVKVLTQAHKLNENMLQICIAFTYSYPTFKYSLYWKCISTFPVAEVLVYEKNDKLISRSSKWDTKSSCFWPGT